MAREVYLCICLSPLDFLGSTIKTYNKNGTNLKPHNRMHPKINKSIIIFELMIIKTKTKHRGNDNKSISRKPSINTTVPFIQLVCGQLAQWVKCTVTHTSYHVVPPEGSTGKQLWVSILEVFLDLVISPDTQRKPPPVRQQGKGMTQQ